MPEQLQIVDWWQTLERSCCGGVTPGLRRAKMETTKNISVGEIGFLEDPSRRIGNQSCEPRGKSKPCGITPMRSRQAVHSDGFSDDAKVAAQPISPEGLAEH